MVHAPCRRRANMRRALASCDLPRAMRETRLAARLVSARARRRGAAAWLHCVAQRGCTALQRGCTALQALQGSQALGLEGTDLEMLWRKLDRAGRGRAQQCTLHVACTWCVACCLLHVACCTLRVACTLCVARCILLAAGFAVWRVFAYLHITLLHTGCIIHRNPPCTVVPDPPRCTAARPPSFWRLGTRAMVPCAPHSAWLSFPEFAVAFPAMSQVRGCCAARRAHTPRRAPCAASPVRQAPSHLAEPSRWANANAHAHP